MEFHEECEALQLPEGYGVHRGIRMCFDNNAGNSKGDELEYMVIVECKDISDQHEELFKADTLNSALLIAYRFIEENTNLETK